MHSLLVVSLVSDIWSSALTKSCQTRKASSWTIAMACSPRLQVRSATFSRVRKPVYMVFCQSFTVYQLSVLWVTSHLVLQWRAANQGKQWPAHRRLLVQVLHLVIAGSQWTCFESINHGLPVTSLVSNFHLTSGRQHVLPGCSCDKTGNWRGHWCFPVSSGPHTIRAYLPHVLRTECLPY